jgi:hypothetical protein
MTFKRGIEMIKRKRNIARLHSAPPRPDFLARLKKIYKKTLKTTGADLVAFDRDRF